MFVDSIHFDNEIESSVLFQHRIQHAYISYPIVHHRTSSYNILETGIQGLKLLILNKMNAACFFVLFYAVAADDSLNKSLRIIQLKLRRKFFTIWKITQTMDLMRMCRICSDLFILCSFWVHFHSKIFTHSV